MTALEAFNALDNREVSRKEVEQVLTQAKAENNTAIIYRLSRVLNDSPEATHFEITITHYDSPVGLSGVQHTGDYREALDDCGRLRKGWKFVKGNVVKVEEKPKKEAKPKKEKAPQKDTKKDKKYKFVVITDDRHSRVIAVFSYTNPNIEELSEHFWKNREGKYYETTEEGLRNYTFGIGFYPFEKAKKHIEKKYTEGKDFIYFNIKKDGGRDKAISLVEKPKKEAKAKKDKAPQKVETTKEVSDTKVKDFEAFEALQAQLLAENADIPESEVLDFLYNFTDAFEEGKTVFRFWNTPGKKPTEAVLQYKKHPLLTRLKNPSAKMRAYELTSRGYQLLEKFHKGVERIKKTYDLGYIAGIHKLYNFLRDRKAYQKNENVQDSSKKKVEKSPNKATKSLKSMKEKGENVAKKTKEEDNFSEQVEKREALLKRANLYRKARKDGYSYDEIYKRAKDLGDKDIDLIMNLSYLNPKGDMINSFLYHIDKEEEYLKMVNWTGEARRLYPDLDDKKEDFLRDLIDSNFYKEKTKDFFFKGIEDWHKRRTERANILKSILNKYKITLDYHSFNLFLEGISNDLYKSNYKELPEYDKYFFYFKLENRLNEKIINDLKKYFVNRIEEKKLKKVGLGDDKYSYKGELHQKGIEILRIIFKKLKEEKGLSGVDYSQGLFGAVSEVSTERFKQMKVSELRAFTLDYYLSHLKGKKVAIKNHLKEVIFTTKAGRKIAKGEAMYSEKAAVIEHLEELIKNSTYNNWGNRKESSPPNIIGYLNFKAKVTIDGEKRHVRISIAVDEKRKFRFKTLEVGANPKKKKQATSIPAPSVTERLRDSSLSESAPTSKATVVNPQDGEVEPLSGDKGTKKSLTRKKKDENFGLNASEAPVTSLPAPRQTLAQQLATRPEVRESFLVADEQMSLFLGALEKKTKDSLVITLTGKQGSGKTRFAFQFMNALAQRYRVGHASIEEHPESVLYEEKAYQYLNDTALEHITAQDVRSLAELDTMIRTNEVIVIDSFQKMRELAPNFEVDKDLRKKYDGKLFLVIFQQTADGKMRGGSKSQFDGDIILFTETFPDYRENYVYPDKNRYNKRPATELQYSIYEQRMLATAPEEPSLSAHYEPTESEELNFEVL